MICRKMRLEDRRVESNSDRGGISSDDDDDFRRGDGGDGGDGGVIDSYLMRQ